MQLWNASMLIGIAAIDKQHEGLVRQIGLLAENIYSGKSSEQFDEMFRFLEKYVIEHFNYEEQLMRENRYPKYEAHRSLHEEFIKNLELYNFSVQNKQATHTESYALFKTLLDWLLTHIMKEDKSIALFIKASQHHSLLQKKTPSTKEKPVA
jgi:hemerythrin-like metal-binding protein